MINLSTESINLHAPYKVEQVDDNIFLFETKHGIIYTVGFVPDTSFMDKGLYQFFITKETGKTTRIDKAILRRFV